MTIFGAVLVYASLALATTHVADANDYMDPESMYTVHWYLEEQQIVIKDYVTAIEEIGLGDSKIKEIANKEFDGFTKYAKEGLKHLLEQAKSDQAKNKSIMDKVSSWMDMIDKVNKPGNEDHDTAKDALGKFENTVADIVKQSEEFNARVSDDPYESPYLLRDLGNFIMNVTTELRHSIKRVAKQVEDAYKPLRSTSLRPIYRLFTTESVIGHAYVSEP